MSEPYQYINAAGLVVPDTSATLAQVQQEWRDTFGQDLVVTADTPQGVMIVAETANRDSVAKNNADLANQINPDYAGGIFLDAIMALMGIGRTKSIPTLVKTASLGGVPGTVIPAGAQARSATGDLYKTLNIVTLDAGGNGSVDFECETSGPIPCIIGALNQIVSGVIGWETVTNPTAGIVGADEQSDQSARAYRKNTLAFQGVSLPKAIVSALYAVQGVRSLWFQENTQATTQTINGISMVAHSIFACVDGGTDTDVAAALLENKSSGCAFVGTTTVNLIEPASKQTYAVKFTRPDLIGILVKVTVANASDSAVKAAVANYANGLLNSVEGFVVGSDVSAFEISGAIVSQVPGAFVKKVEISYSASISWTTDNLAIAVDELAYTNEGFVTVVVG